MNKRLLSLFLSVLLTSQAFFIPTYAEEYKISSEQSIDVESESAAENNSTAEYVPKSEEFSETVPNDTVSSDDTVGESETSIPAAETDITDEISETDVADKTSETDRANESSETDSTVTLSAPQDPVEEFVSRLYKTLLYRNPDPTGLSEWTSALKSNRESGSSIISGFILSPEFQEKSYTNSQFIETLYNAILGRSSDPDGLSDWCAELEAGLSRLCVCSGFVNSKEFKELCQSYGISIGTMPLTAAADKYPNITKFVVRIYRLVLGREADTSGLNAWVTQLYTGRNNAADIVRGFVESKEFREKKLSNSDYITTLYRALLNREPDKAGLNSWLKAIKRGESNLEILKGFVESNEFTKLCKSYGIERGSIIIGRVYQNPSQYYQIQNTISLSGGGYNLNIGYEGLKVAYVIRALGLGNAIGLGGAYYSRSVSNYVKVFQKNHGLTPNGIVDLSTWKALGYTEDEWYNLGAYVSPVRVNDKSTRSDCIEAMISRAYDYLGTSYIIGASGAPGTGVDCSGLVMQACYAGGLDFSPINPVRHSYPGYEYESANLWASSKLKHVSYSQRQRGDLIFYQNSRGSVIHVAIYLGNDQVIESTCAPFNKVVIQPIKNAYRSNIKGVARPYV